MSPRAVSVTGGGSGGRSAMVGLGIVIVAIGMFLLARASPSPDSFDPRSSRPDGTRALLLLLEQQGATVTVTRDVPDLSTLDGDDTSDRRVLVLDDRLDGGQRSDLLDWVEAGGVLVVADPASTLHGGPGLDGGAVVVERGMPLYTDVGLAADAANNVRNTACDIAALEELHGLYVDNGVLFPVGGDEPQCFGDAAEPTGHAFVIRHALGDGTVVGLGDNHLVTNEWIRYADNSGLATALLAPSAGTKVTILLGSGATRTVDDVGSGDQSLRDLVRPSVWMAMVQLAVAFVVFAAARGVRVGRPVAEPRPVPLAGSEFVRASGSIMRAAQHHERAGWMLRTELHRDLCRRYRIDHASTVDRVAWTAEDRDGIAPDLARRALQTDAVDDRSLLELAGLVDRIRHHITEIDARAAAPVSTPDASASSSRGATP